METVEERGYQSQESMGWKEFTYSLVQVNGVFTSNNVLQSHFNEDV